MVEQLSHTEASSLTGELEASLGTLQAALAEAGRAVAAIRGNVSRIAALTEAVSTMETAMSLARRNLNQSWSGQQAAAPPLRAVPASDVAAQADLEAQARELAALARQREAPVQQVPAQAPPPPPEPVPAASHCLRLRVGSRIGSLDLKAVDGAVNENPAVVDVALLDYDGRQATLKLWFSTAADPTAARDALVSSLRRRLGDEGVAEVRAEFEEGSAA